MIRRKIDAQTQADFDIWWQANKDELESHFQGYLSKEDKDWIDQTYREHLRTFITEDGNKCAYCERDPNDGGGFLEIEHFFPKRHFPDQAFDLNNLLPSCKQCNTAKSSNTNSSGKEILNPREDEPRNSFELDLDNLKLKGKEELGKKTLRNLGASLNSKRFLQTNADGEVIDQKGALFAREKIRNDLEELLKYLDHTRLPDFLRTRLEKIDPKDSMTATYATIICDSPTYKALFERLDKEEMAALSELLLEKRRYSLCGASFELQPEG